MTPTDNQSRCNTFTNKLGLENFRRFWYNSVECFVVIGIWWKWRVCWIYYRHVQAEFFFLNSHQTCWINHNFHHKFTGLYIFFHSISSFSWIERIKFFSRYCQKVGCDVTIQDFAKTFPNPWHLTYARTSLKSIRKLDIFVIFWKFQNEILSWKSIDWNL